MTLGERCGQDLGSHRVDREAVNKWCDIMEEAEISPGSRRSDNEKPVCSSEPQRLGDQRY